MYKLLIHEHVYVILLDSFYQNVSITIVEIKLNNPDMNPFLALSARDENNFVKLIILLAKSIQTISQRTLTSGMKTYLRTH